MDWLWQDTPAETKYLGKKGRLVDHVVSRVGTVDAIEKNLSPSLEQRDKEITTRCRETHLVGHSYWGNFIHSQFREMDRGQVRRFVVASGDHAMGLLLKVKTERTSNQTQYVAEFYDPNLTLTHVRLVGIDLAAIQNWRLAQFMSNETRKAYFGALKPGAMDEKVLVCRRLPDDLPKYDVSSPLWPEPDHREVRIHGNAEERKHPVLGYHLMQSNLPLAAWMEAMDEVNSFKIVDQLAAKCASGTSGLYMALQEGYKETVGAFIAGLSELARQGLVTGDEAAELLAARRATDTPGLYMALQMGHQETVSAFIAGLSKLGLQGTITADQTAMLLTAKNAHGTPGLHSALQAGHRETVSAFIAGVSEVLRKNLITADHAAGLLAAKRTDDLPGLYMALQEGHMEAVNAFIAGVTEMARKGLITDAHVTGLLTAQEPGGAPGLHKALHDGHAQVVTTFIAGVSELLRGGLITADQAVALLAAQDVDYGPGLYMAQQNEHKETVAAFVAGVAELVRDNLITADQAAGLLAAKDVDGTSG